MPLNGKRPIESWEYYQSHLPSERQLQLWWSLNRDANIGVITGQISNLVVIDFDKYAKLIYPQAYLLIKRHTNQFITSRTGNGFHCLIRTDEANEIRNTKVARKNGLVMIETRGEGGYIVAPPSIHPSGRKYEFTNGKRIGDLKVVKAETIKEILNELKQQFDVKSDEPLNFSINNGNYDQGGEIEVVDIVSFLDRVIERETKRVANSCSGERNLTLFKAAASLGSFTSYLNESEIAEKLLMACVDNGLLQDDGGRSAVSTIKSGLKRANRITLIENPFKDMGVFTK